VNFQMTQFNQGRAGYGHRTVYPISSISDFLMADVGFAYMFYVELKDLPHCFLTWVCLKNEWPVACG